MDAIGNKSDYTQKYLPYLLLLVSVTSIISWTSLNGTILNNTTVLWTLYAIILLLLKKVSIRDYRVIPVRLFLMWMFCSFCYGLCMSRNYWDYKLLVSNVMTFSLPLLVYTFVNPNTVRYTLKVWFTKWWVLFVLLCPFMYSDAYANFLQPFVLPALFFPILSKKWKLLVISVLAITAIFGFASRSCSTRLVMALIIGLLANIKFVFSKFKILTVCLWIAPVLLFILGASNTFNVFKIDDEYEISKSFNLKTEKTAKNDVLLEDTRTLVYYDVIGSSIDNKYWLFGHSLARGYESFMFGDAVAANKGIGNLLQGERPACEVSVLNVFTYMGLIGLVLYMIIFVCGSYLAVFKSSNTVVPVLGVFLSFRWFFGWIEDFSTFNYTYIILWIIISMCYSPYFRTMSNMDIHIWLNKVFEIRKKDKF